MVLRRLYLYGVGGASLGMLVTGLTNLGNTFIDLFGGRAIGPTIRDSLASFGALTVVGLPVWALHWGSAQRLSRRNPAERAAALRRLYLYLVAAALLVAATIFGYRLLDEALRVGVLKEPLDGVRLARSAWALLLTGAFWAYHFRVAGLDRLEAGEEEASATLRRWYAYGATLLGLALLLFGSRDLLRSTWVNLAQISQVLGPDPVIPGAISRVALGLSVWLFHSEWTARGAVGAADRQSTLRAVQGFLALAGSVALALTGASQLLYYALARLLGIQSPGGVQGDLSVALASPGSTVLVFAGAWLLFRQRLAGDASGAEAVRQAGVRRLYTHLVALLALATLAVGLGGLLWTLSDQALSVALRRPAGEWRDQVSLFITLALVGLPMWLAHWRPAPQALERATLSRRLYVYAALLASMLALLGSGAVLVYRLLSLLLATSQATSEAAVLDMGRAFAVLLVASGVAGYHWRILLQDSNREVGPPVAEASAAPYRGVLLRIDVVGATEAEVRQALTRLPPGAGYSFRPPAAPPDFPSPLEGEGQGGG